MAFEINIPKLGMIMSEAKLVEWKVEEGDWLEKGSIVLTIETEKISWDVEATASGFLHIVVDKGNVAVVGTIVGYIAETKGELETLQKTHPTVQMLEAIAVPTVSTPPVEGVTSKGKESVVASPAARRLASELGIDLVMITGGGPGGRITEVDVAKYHTEGPRPPKITPLAEEMARRGGLDISKITGTGEGGKIAKEDVERVLALRKKEKAIAPAKSIPFTGIRKSIAQNMHSSLHKTAQVTIFTEVDVTELVRFRELVKEEYKKDEAVKISLNDIIILATSRALKRFPILNSALVGEEILIHDSVNMGIAVTIPDGLIVPVLFNADKKGLLEISRETRDLAQKARNGTLAVDEVTGGTFTISNTGMLDIDASTPILKPPETGILGVGRVKEKPAIYNKEIAIRSMMVLSLTFDHQVVDGALSSMFLSTLGKYLQNPTLMMT